MARRRRSPSERIVDLERELARLRRDVAAFRRRQDVVFGALRLDARARKGDRGVVRDLQESVVRLEDHLLKANERIENILNALTQHRELLVAMNRRLLDVGTRDRIRVELDVMKNTLSILAMNGIEFDADLVKDIETLRAGLRDAKDLTDLEKAKGDLDRRFHGELKKFDLDAIWAKRKDIPGYR
ncbi:MAG: hypothetical protein ACT4OI_08145 [Methanobacteriota archaeon]